MDKLPDKINLSKDFPEINYEKWREQVERDLKGQPFDKKLITKTYEGIDLQPIYNREDIEKLPFIDSKPGFKDFVRGTKSAGYFGKTWSMQQSIPYIIPEEFSRALQTDLSRGQNCVFLKPDLDENYSGLIFDSLEDITEILKGVDITEYPIYIESGMCGAVKLALISAFLKSKNIPFEKLNGSLGVDPLSYLATRGTLHISTDLIHNSMYSVTEWALRNAPEFRTIGVSTIPYQNAGATAIQELAFSMATGVTYFNQLLEKEIVPNDIAKMFRFSFGIGSFFFMEVAKFRAARILWSKILEQYGVDKENRKIEINAEVSESNQTKLDAYVNMLRNTTEAFSALVGGVNSLRTAPFDDTFRVSDEFSRRIARNTQIVLEEESHISGLIDPAGGSYFVEYLTNEVASKSFDLFKEIQSKGGMLKALQDGFIQDTILAVADTRKKDLSKRKSVLVGTNMYANMKEDIPEDRKEDINKIKILHKKALDKVRKNRDENRVKELLGKIINGSNIDGIIEAVLSGALKDEIISAMPNDGKDNITINPIIPYKASEIFEELRNLSNEYKNKTGEFPSILLVTMGGHKQHKARADFSRGFLEVAGFNVIYEKGFNTTDEAIESVLKHKVKAIVICSTDDTYPELVPQICEGIKANKSI